MLVTNCHCILNLPGITTEHVSPVNVNQTVRSRIPTVPVHRPFWIHSVQLLSVMKPSPQWSHSSPVHPTRQVSHCPGGPKLTSQKSQFPPVHPSAQNSQVSPVHPVSLVLPS